MRKEFCVCVDSDGCAIDAMTIKHERCFGPAALEVFELEGTEEELLDCWNDINLYTATRGINRFKGLSMFLDEFSTMPAGELDAFRKWTQESSELSNAALTREIEAGAGGIFIKALEWSNLVNSKISELPVNKPFDNVKEALGRAAERATVTVVSSANREAIEKEWDEAGLLELTDVFYSQTDGSKQECIAKMLDAGYDKDKVIMVGDAPGDYAAAAANGVWYYPILAGRETESWKDFGETYLDKFLAGEFNEDVQESLINAMKENLHID